MAIQVNCAGCGKQFRAKDQFRNTKLRCPNCKADVLVQGPHVFGSDVFVSYSSADKSVADAVCGAIEGTKGFRCWMAPRDIPPGASWGSAIIEGIEDCRLILLVFSEEANKSDQVLREVERAVAKKVPVVPLRIDKGPMRKDFEYFLAACHWIDATSGALEDHLAGLTRHIRHLLLDRAEVEADQKAYAPAPRSERVVGAAAAHAPPSPSAKRVKFGIILAAAAAVAIGLVVAAIVVIKQRGDASAAAAAAPNTSAPATSAPSAAAASEPIDLLARVKLEEDGWSGNWTRTPDGPMVNGPMPGRVRFGEPPPGDYDMHVVFTPLVGDEGVGILLSRFGENFEFMCGLRGTPQCGFGLEKGKISKKSSNHSPGPLMNNVKHDVVVKVRRHTATAIIDGRPASELVTANYAELSVPRTLAVGKNALGFATYRSAVIHVAEVIPVKEEETP